MNIQIVILFSAIFIDRSYNLNTNLEIQLNNVKLIVDDRYIETNNSVINYDEQLYAEFKQSSNRTVGDQHCVNANIRLSGQKTLLHMAASKGETQTLHNLIDQYKVPVDSRDTWGREPLYYAVQKGQVEAALILLQRHANPDSKDTDNKPILHLVVDLDEIDALNMVKISVHNKANINITDKYNNTLLHIATKKGYLSIIKFLLEKGASVNAQNINNDTPLRLAKILQPNRSDIASFLTQKGAEDLGERVDFLNACDQRNLKLIKYLHEVRAVDVQVKDYLKQNGLFKAIDRKGDLEIVKYLVNIGVRTSEVDSTNRTLVNWAVYCNQFDIAKYLIERGVVCRNVDKFGNTPLHDSAQNDNLEMVKHFLHLGLDANINDKGANGKTPLSYARFVGNLKLVQYLIRSGAKINLNDRTALKMATLYDKHEIKLYLEQLQNDSTLQTQIDTNSLFFVATQNNIKLVEQYLNKNISVNLKDEDDGQTPLYRAIDYNGQLDMIKFLHSKGADVKQFDVTKSDNLIYLSIIKRKFDVANYLIENGADIKTPGVSGNTPLHGAMEMGNTELIKLLLDKEGYDSRKNSNGKSPLDLLIETRNEKMIRNLIFEYKDSEGKSILHQISSQGQNSDIAFVLERGAHVNSQDNAQNSALHLAALNGHLETVKLLSQQICIHIGAKNVNGQTAYDLAQHNQKHSVEQYLSELMKTKTDHQS